MKYTPENITNLNDNEIFVFGSNLAGRHGKGAAKIALRFGAKYGTGVGMVGQTYAIPTKDFRLNVLLLDEIAKYVEIFIEFARNNPDKTFLVTKIGCGLAGYRIEDIAPLFAQALTLENVILPKEFVEICSRVHPFF